MKQLLTLAALAAACSAALAGPFYMQGAVGASHISEDCSGLPSCSNNGTAISLTAGYSFSKTISGELTYIDYGKAKASGPGGDASVAVTGYQVGAGFHLPINDKLSGVLRTGLAFNHAKADANVYYGHLSDSKSKTALYLGAGLAYDIDTHFAVTGDVNLSKANDSTTDMNVTAFTVGVKYGF